MNDLPPGVWSNHPRIPTREQLAQWIHQNYYTAGGIYRMSCVQDFVKYFLL